MNTPTPQFIAQTVCLALWRMAGGKENEKVRTTDEELCNLVVAIGVPTSNAQIRDAISRLLNGRAIYRVESLGKTDARYKVNSVTRDKAKQAATTLGTELLPIPPKIEVVTTDLPPIANPGKSIYQFSDQSGSAAAETPTPAPTADEKQSLAMQFMGLLADAEDAPKLRAKIESLCGEILVLGQRLEIALAEPVGPTHEQREAAKKAASLLDMLIQISGEANFQAYALLGICKDLGISLDEMIPVQEALAGMGRGAVSEETS